MSAVNIVDELEKLVSLNLNNLPIETNNPIPNEINVIDFNIIESNIKGIAEKYVDSYIKYYSEGLSEFNNQDVLLNKRGMDIHNLTDTLYSMFISMHALKKIAIQIESSSVSGRLIEGLAAILEKKKNYNGQLAQLEVYIKDSYKLLVDEWKNKNNITEIISGQLEENIQDAEIINQPINVVRGTRDLLNRIKQ